MCGLGVGVWLELRVGKKRGGGGPGTGERATEQRTQRQKTACLWLSFAASQRACKSRLEREGSDDIADTQDMELLALWKALERNHPVGPDEMHLKAKEKEQKKKKKKPTLWKVLE